LVLNTLHLNILCFLLFSSTVLFAQESTQTGQTAVEFGVKYGRIFKHTPRFLPTITENSTLYELTISKQTIGKKHWHQAHNYPILSCSMIYARYGDADIFGQGIGLLPSMTFLTRRPKFNVHYRIGAGLSYISRPFDRSTNAENNVIGSHINNITMFMLGFEWLYSPQLRLSATASFTHFSNAKVQAPNLGINIPAGGITLKYFPKPPIRQYRKDSLPSFKRPIRLNVLLGYGFQEFERAGGPRYPVYIFTPYLSKRINLKGQVTVGFDVNYYMRIYHFVLNQVAFQEDKALKALKIAPFIGYEFYFGRLSTIGQIGHYVYNPFLQDVNFFAKLGLQLHLYPTDQHFDKQLFIGVYMKSHFARADFLQIGIGYVF